MMFPGPGERKAPSYKSYKARWLEKYVRRQKALIQGVKESSLKEEDKQLLINTMLLQFPIRDLK